MNKTNSVNYIPAVIIGITTGIITSIVTDGLSFINMIVVAMAIGFLVGIVWLLGKKLLAYMNK